MATKTKGNAMQERSRHQHPIRTLGTQCGTAVAPPPLREPGTPLPSSSARRASLPSPPRADARSSATGQQQSPRHAMGNGRPCPVATRGKDATPRRAGGRAPPLEAAANSLVPVHAVRACAEAKSHEGRKVSAPMRASTSNPRSSGPVSWRQQLLALTDDSHSHRGLVVVAPSRLKRNGMQAKPAGPCEDSEETGRRGASMADGSIRA
jgi:hypothetical protein